MDEWGQLKLIYRILNHEATACYGVNGVGMKFNCFCVLFFLLLLTSGCATKNKLEARKESMHKLSGLEQIVLCKESKEAAESMSSLKNIERYGTKNNRFYYPVKPIDIFEMQVRFVGYGVMYVNGPNVTVTGSFNELKERVENIMGNATACKRDLCGWKKPEEKTILVYVHPEDPSMAIVQCAYGII